MYPAGPRPAETNAACSSTCVSAPPTTNVAYARIAPVTRTIERGTPRNPSASPAHHPNDNVQYVALPAAAYPSTRWAAAASAADHRTESSVTPATLRLRSPGGHLKYNRMTEKSRPS